MRRLLIGLIALSACGGSSVDLTPVIASSAGSIGTGQQRVLVAFAEDASTSFAASDDMEVVATLRDRIGSPLGEYTGELVWIIPDIRGLFAFDVEIPGPGTFQMTFRVDGSGELGPAGLVAVQDPPVVEAGDPAPKSATRTRHDHELADITSDPAPEPSFYDMTVAEAVSSGPSVIVFATPAWCTSQSCGPMLDQVKALSTDYTGLNFVHVEIYEDIHVASAADLVAVPAIAEWGLLAEPWLFVIDAEGIVAASFEGAVSDAELVEAFDAVSP